MLRVLDSIFSVRDGKSDTPPELSRMLLPFPDSRVLAGCSEIAVFCRP